MSLYEPIFPPVHRTQGQYRFVEGPIRGCFDAEIVFVLLRFKGTFATDPQLAVLIGMI